MQDVQYEAKLKESIKVGTGIQARLICPNFASPINSLFPIVSSMAEQKLSTKPVTLSSG